MLVHSTSPLLVRYQGRSHRHSRSADDNRSGNAIPTLRAVMRAIPRCSKLRAFKGVRLALTRCNGAWKRVLVGTLIVWAKDLLVFGDPVHAVILA